MLTWRKKVAFSALTTVLFFVLASTAVLILERLGWIDTERLNDRVAYAPIRPIVVENTPNGPVAHIVDPAMIKSHWPVRVPPNTLRILLAGGSFAEGNPYSGSSREEFTASPGSIHGWLEQLLRARYPDLGVEVINIAAGGANSSRVRGLIKAAMVLHPQIVITAMGNNEGFNPGNINQAMHRWIVYRILKKELTADAPTKPQNYWMVQTREFSKYKDRLGENLAAVEKIVTEHNAQYLVSIMPINLDYDFLAETGRPESDPDLDEGERLLNAGDAAAAIERLATAPTSGYQARLLAQAHEALAEYDLAREAYQLAMTFFHGCRTVPDVNALIADFARSRGLPVADLDDALRQASANGLTTHVFFCDSCHMNWKGYYIVALEMARAIERGGLIPAGHASVRAFPTSDEILELPAWERLATNLSCMTN